MALLRFKMLGGVLLGLLVLVAVLALLGRPHETPPPAVESRPTTGPEVVAAPAAETPAPAARTSRSKGQSDWAFFFRAGDTLSRMTDGVALGVVVRLERAHSFPGGSAGPAYVVRSADQRETVFDADELERSARIEAIRDLGRPPAGKPSR
jgi:hypothetical protein